MLERARHCSHSCTTGASFWSQCRLRFGNAQASSALLSLLHDSSGGLRMSRRRVLVHGLEVIVTIVAIGTIGRDGGSGENAAEMHREGGGCKMLEG